VVGTRGAQSGPEPTKSWDKGGRVDFPSPPKVGTKAGAWILNLNIFPFLFSNVHEFSFNCQKKSGLEPTKTSETIDSSRNSPLLHDGQEEKKQLLVGSITKEPTKSSDSCYKFTTATVIKVRAPL